MRRSTSYAGHSRATADRRADREGFVLTKVTKVQQSKAVSSMALCYEEFFLISLAKVFYVLVKI